MQSTTRLPSRVRRRQQQQARTARRTAAPAPSRTLSAPGCLFPDTHPTGLPETIPLPSVLRTEQTRSELEALQRGLDTYRQSPWPDYIYPPGEGVRTVSGCHPDPRVHELVAVVLGSLWANHLPDSNIPTSLMSSTLIDSYLRPMGIPCQIVLGWITLPEEDRRLVTRYAWLELEDGITIAPDLWLSGQVNGGPIPCELLPVAGPECERFPPEMDPGNREMESIYPLYQSDEAAYWRATMATPCGAAVDEAFGAALMVTTKWLFASGE